MYLKYLLLIFAFTIVSTGALVVKRKVKNKRHDYKSYDYDYYHHKSYDYDYYHHKSYDYDYYHHKSYDYDYYHHKSYNYDYGKDYGKDYGYYGKNKYLT
ncbi:uncharacterized protein OCT59_022203 [Rhizophagus irregularis]|uniref:uncharacterized protein n=1 Tax=Rhizophagus irregularis TaxID=588596 RepID=UPI0019FAF21A|nr:hypothetical protein OCT59_022203 [Rhizophagus irregularis]GET56290.1 hypothetical protein GLOIN_2v1766388 [Rhizophagus irregularis DAOM 181602=DAOM 197198]